MWPFSSKPRAGQEASDDRGKPTTAWTGREQDMTLTRAYRAIVCELSEQKQAFDRLAIRFHEAERTIKRLQEWLDAQPPVAPAKAAPASESRA